MSSNDKNRFTAYQFDPFELCIIGGTHCPEGGGPLDTDAVDGPGYDARVLQPITESDVLDVIDQGILQPIIIRKNGRTLKVVWAGRNRVRRARLATKRTGKTVMVPCVFHDGTDHDFLKKQIAENSHRSEDHFANQAIKAQGLRKYGDSDEQIAVTMKCTEAAVRNYFKYFELDQSVQDAMKKGDITGSAAIKLVELTREEQATELASLVKKAKANGHAKVKVAAAAQGAKKRAGKAEEGTKKWGLRAIGKVIAHEKAEELPEGFVLGMRWVMGDLPSEKIKGLKAILKDLFLVDEEG